MLLLIVIGHLYYVISDSASYNTTYDPNYTITVLVKKTAEQAKNTYSVLLKYMEYVLYVKVPISHHDILKSVEI